VLNTAVRRRGEREGTCAVCYEPQPLWTEPLRVSGQGVGIRLGFRIQGA